MTERKNFFSYVIPSLFAFALSGVYTIVDGFFIGRNLGDIGIAAITIGYPVAALIQAVGTGIGLAGAIRYSVFDAKNNTDKRDNCLAITLLLMVAASLTLTLVFFFLARPVLTLLGAKGEVLKLSEEYVKIIALGGVFQLLATGFTPFMRNMGGSSWAMFAMIFGFATNIFLDYLFVSVLQKGMSGAAWATIIGQIITMLTAIVFFAIKKCKIHISDKKSILSTWAKILKVAISPFGLTFSPTITLLLMNKFLLIYGNDQAVAVYGCIGYITSIIYLLLQGTGDGGQPLISFYHGKNDETKVRKTVRQAYVVGAVITAICVTLVFLFKDKVGILFGSSAESNEYVAKYLPLFLASMIFLCYTRITTSYFYAIEKTKQSYILVYAEPILTLLFLAVLPLFMKILGVWLAVPLAQLVACAVSVVIKIKTSKHLF